MLYVIPARDADTALVFRRGPSAWWHLLEWRLDPPRLLPGAWFRGSLYPTRCDLSPDGRYLGYFALKPTARDWPAAWFAVSKVPFLHALAAWRTAGTWTWGCRFAAERSLAIHACMEDKPFHGAYPHKAACHGMSCDWAAREVWNETKRGWEPENSSILRRRRPGGGPSLVLIHGGEGKSRDYLIESSAGNIIALPDAVWCDWDRAGRLLTATRQGALSLSLWDHNEPRPLWTADLKALRPAPAPPPDWATRW